MVKRTGLRLVIALTVVTVMLARAPGAGASSGGALLGVYYGNQGWNMAQVQALEAWQGKRDAIVNLYTNWDSSSHTITNLFGQQLPAIWANHNVPMITWQPTTGSNPPTNIDALVARGNYDSYLSTWATDLKSFLAGPDKVYGTADDRRTYLRFAHEANGNWYPWSPADSSNTASDYIAMWRHVYTLLTSAGLDANHVQWVWAANNVDVGASTAEQLYPGNSYVNWVAIDGYNWGASQSWSSWQSPDQVFAGMIGRLRVLTSSAVPLAITELASTSSTTTGTSVAAKSGWISGFYSYALSNGVGMVCWFNQDKEADWAVFGGSNGDATFTYGKTTYKTYAAYKTAIQALASTESSNPRLLSDAEFEAG